MLVCERKDRIHCICDPKHSFAAGSICLENYDINFKASLYNQLVTIISWLLIITN